MCVVVTGTYCTDLEDWDLNLLNSPGAVHSVPSCNTQDRRGTDQREPVGERKRGGGGEREQRETAEEDSSEKHRFYDFFLGTEYDLTGRALSVNKQDYKEIQRADWLFGKGGEIVRSSLVRIAQQMKSNWEKHNNMPPKPRGQSIRRRVLTGKLSKQMSANAYK